MQLHSSTSEIDQFDDSSHPQPCDTASYAFPRHWDFIKVHAPSKPCGVFNLTPDHIVSELQPEYWWRNNGSSSGCFKQLWLAHEGLADDRNELTEYQIVREIIWSLLGARSSYIFRVFYDPEKLLNNRVFTSKRASLATLTYTTLDSLLDTFARFATHCLILHVCVQFISQSAMVIHPCIIAFGACLDDYLADFARHLQILKTRSRGPHSFTLSMLHFSVLPWSRRMYILATILTQLTAGYVSSLTESGAHIRLLDMLYYANVSFSDCFTDTYLLSMLNSSFSRTFFPYLSSTVHLLSGTASSHDCINCLFVETAADFKLTDPNFWKQSFLDASCSNASLRLTQIPRFFLPVLSELVGSLKALCILSSLSEAASDRNILKPVTIEPASFLSTTAKSLFNSDTLPPDTVPMSTSELLATSMVEDRIGLRVELLASVSAAVGASFRDTRDHMCPPSMEIIRKTLKTFIRTRCTVLNQYLVSILLTPSHLMNYSFRSLGDALAAVGSVYLFGAGDRMNDFARHLFGNIKALKPWHKDLVGLTLCLRSQFDSKLISFFMSTESSSFTFVSPYKSTFEPYSSLGSVLESFNFIKLNYDAQWPCTIILNDHAIDVYSGVFSFLLKVKYVKWLLESLHFAQLTELGLGSISYHHMLLLRVHMLYIFAGLHDFLVHRVESLRLRFVQKWGLPDVLHFQNTCSTVIPGDLGQLIDDHESVLCDLESICLLTESSSMLRSEINNLCRMVLTFHSLWSQCRFRHDLLPQLTELGSAFHNHIKFLAQLLSRAVRLSNAKRLLPLTDTFIIASSFACCL